MVVIHELVCLSVSLYLVLFRSMLSTVTALARCEDIEVAAGLRVSLRCGHFLPAAPRRETQGCGRAGPAPVDRNRGCGQARCVLCLSFPCLLSPFFMVFK